MKPTLVVMVKEPRPGRVKTRLGRDIGMTAAAWWFRHQTRRVLRRLTDPRWHLILAVSPDYQGLNSRIWPENLPRVAQGSGNLGDRMGRLMRGLPKGPVAIIGADIPGVTPVHIKAAFEALGTHDAVFGPAPDGGYWLVGLKRSRAVPNCLFQGVRWSSEFALADTKASMPDLNIAEIAVLQDIDTVADLKTG
ncbi:TIGR04282 family arsenosugar biosynthesis glycosyltransferase [Algirhabdus cladophorae]|uniref:TIGR04282 family arsenosugar biosynthesis glycosyltransferase n=1 Tax=Algirhabdus cladophorae TaxID=3377108 RepID=UPI003B84777B